MSVYSHLESTSSHQLIRETIIGLAGTDEQCSNLQVGQVTATIDVPYTQLTFFGSDALHPNCWYWVLVSRLTEHKSQSEEREMPFTGI